MLQWIGGYQRVSIKAMRAEGLWFDARPNRTLSPTSRQRMENPWNVCKISYQRN